MKQLRHSVAGEPVTINVVEAEEDLDEFAEFIRGNLRFLGLDSETTGLDIYAESFRCRVVQFGTPTQAWVVPVEREGRYAEEVRLALRAVQGFVLHNASFDLQVFDRTLGVPMEELWPKVTDTRILAHLVDPRAKDEGGIGHSLEELTRHYVDSEVADSVKTLMNDLAKTHHTTKANVWKKVPFEDPDYQLYSGMDPILAARLLRKLIPLIPSTSSSLVEYEHKLAMVCSSMERTGFLLDVAYAEKLSAELKYEESRNNEIALNHGCEMVNSTDQVADALESMGVKIKGRTPTGKRQVNDDLLVELRDADLDSDIAEFCNAVIEAKKAGKWRKTWVEKFLDQRDAGDRCHASINPLRARTARMCLPYSERLVTQRGILHIDQAEVGDKTLDATGQWVRINAIHKYDNAPVVTYQSHRRGKPARYSLRSTAEHRWLQVSSKGNVGLRPITAGSQTKVRLAPLSLFDPLSGREFIADTPGEVAASIVGLLVSDGRLAPGYKLGEGYSALIYQSERKFYKQILDLLPEGLVSYDRLIKEDHHEIGLRLRELRKILPAELFSGVLLKNSNAIVQWCNSIPVNECAAFLRACYLADGATAAQHRVISAQPSPAQMAMRMAGYRCGWLSTIQESGESEWSNGPRERISFRRATLAMTSMTQEVTSHEPVWCVSTASGTFTAEGAVGIYLTGNSITGIPAQTLPAGDSTIRRCFLAEEGHRIASVDYQAQELRVLAALSEDRTMIEAFRNNADLHQMTADAAGVDRKVGKMANFLQVYGGGPGKLAQSAGIEFPAAKRVVDAFAATYPGVARLSQQLQRDAAADGYITTPVGRRLPVDPTRAYSALNYVIQSSSRDVTGRGLIRLHEAGFTPYLRLPIHDEVLASVPAERAEWGAREIGRVMTEQMGPVVIGTDPEVGLRSWGSLYNADY